MTLQKQKLNNGDTKVEARAQQKKPILYDEIIFEKRVDGVLSALPEYQIIKDINQILGVINTHYLKRIEAIQKNVDTEKAKYYQNKTDLTVQKLLVKTLSYKQDAENRKNNITDLKSKFPAEDSPQYTDEFKDFNFYEKFAHLYADDLSFVARMVDVLIDSIRSALKTNITNATIKKAIEEKLKDLEYSRSEIKICMLRHIEVYEKNKEEYQKQNPPHATIAKDEFGTTSELGNSELINSIVDLTASTDGLKDSLLNNSLIRSATFVDSKKLLGINNDIVFALHKKINDLFGGEQIVPAKLNGWEDCSLEHALPEFPFKDNVSPGLTVLGYFKEYNPNKKTETTSFSLLILGSTLTNWISTWVVRNISSITAQINSAVQAGVEIAQDKVEDILLQFLDPAAYTNKQYEENIKDIRERQEERKNPPEPITDNFVLVSDKKEEKEEKEENRKEIEEKEEEEEPEIVSIQAQLSADEKQRVNDWKLVIKALRLDYVRSVAELTNSCFNIFYGKKISDQVAKRDALEALENDDIKSLKDLKTVADKYINDPQVNAGWFSRTKEIIQFITQDKDPENFRYAESANEIKARMSEDARFNDYRNTFTRMW